MCIKQTTPHEWKKLNKISDAIPTQDSAKYDDGDILPPCPHSSSFSLSFKNFHKNRHSKAFRYIILIFLAAIMCIGVLAAGFRINTSPSVERGLWLLCASENPQKNNYVIVPSDSNPGLMLAVERGYSTPRSVYLKKIIGVEGDFIDYDIDEKSITVNGEYVLMTEIYSQDKIGQSLPRTKYPVLLQKGEAWLSSEYIRGFDSRYFGPVSIDKLTKAIPIFTFR